jgi:hypothetical protein
MADEKLTLIGFLRAMPKAELHCHLLGTVRYATFVELAERSRAPLERAEIDAFYTRGEKPVGVLRVLRALLEGLPRGAPCRAQDHGACRRIRHALDQCRDRA